MFDYLRLPPLQSVEVGLQGLQKTFRGLQNNKDRHLLISTGSNMFTTCDMTRLHSEPYRQKQKIPPS